MIGGIDVEVWLAERSSSVLRTEREIVFVHPGGRKSLLLLATGYRPSSGCPPLNLFFEKYDGGYIGDGFLLIGTPGDSVTTSSGIVIPTLDEMRSISREQGIALDDRETPFMTNGYMFVYSMLGDGRLRCHDRDFGTVIEDRTISNVLNDWWAIQETENGAETGETEG